MRGMNSVTMSARATNSFFFIIIIIIIFAIYLPTEH